MPVILVLPVNKVEFATVRLLLTVAVDVKTLIDELVESLFSIVPVIIPESFRVF